MSRAYEMERRRRAAMSQPSAKQPLVAVPLAVVEAQPPVHAPAPPAREEEQPTLVVVEEPPAPAPRPTRPKAPPPTTAPPPTDEPIAIPTGETAFDLIERDIPEPVRHCGPWVVEGVNLIASRPKLGKTTLERQKMAAAVTADRFFDAQFLAPVRCAFLSLEEGELLCRAKFKMAGFTDEALGGIQLFFDWPRGKTGVDLLDRYLQANADTKLVVIDSLSKFRSVPDVRTPAFQADYAAMTELHDLTKRHPGVAVDVIHHTRKVKSDDPLDDISGTYGLSAAVDSYMVLRHHADGALMFVGGRLWDRDVCEYRLRRADQRWEMLGPNNGLSDEQAETLELVRQSIGGMSGLALGQHLGITKQSAWQRLDALIEKGVATKRYGKVHAR